VTGAKKGLRGGRRDRWLREKADVSAILVKGAQMKLVGVLGARSGPGNRGEKDREENQLNGKEGDQEWHFVNASENKRFARC